MGVPTVARQPQRGDNKTVPVWQRRPDGRSVIAAERRIPHIPWLSSSKPVPRTGPSRAPISGLAPPASSCGRATLSGSMTRTPARRLPRPWSSSWTTAFSSTTWPMVPRGPTNRRPWNCWASTVRAASARPAIWNFPKRRPARWTSPRPRAPLAHCRTVRSCWWIWARPVARPQAPPPRRDWMVPPPQSQRVQIMPPNPAPCCPNRPAR